MPPRVLVVSASSGGGHVRAAQAVELALRELAPDAAVTNIDVLEHSSAFFRRFFSKTYFSAIAKAPHFMGYMYDMLDKARPKSPAPVEEVRGAIRNLNLKPFLALLKSEPWDLVIHTHSLSLSAMAAERRRGRIRIPHFVVTTDFDPHRIWVHLPAERFFVATDEARVNLASAGVPIAGITVTGIPIHPVFAVEKSPAECRRALDLDDRPVVVLNASGLTPAGAQTMYRGLIGIEVPLNLIAVTGRSPQTKRRLELIAVARRHRANVLGFTDQMDVIMGAASLIVTKPGGLTTSECLARGTPMALVEPIPGQETRNADYLLENGAAIKVNNYASLALKVGRILQDPQRLAAMRRSARSIAKPRAAFEIAKVALDSIR